jgi:hypothetical protein
MRRRRLSKMLPESVVLGIMTQRATRRALMVLPFSRTAPSSRVPLALTLVATADGIDFWSHRPFGDCRKFSIPWRDIEQLVPSAVANGPHRLLGIVLHVFADDVVKPVPMLTSSIRRQQLEDLAKGLNQTAVAARKG